MAKKIGKVSRRKGTLVYVDNAGNIFEIERKNAKKAKKSRKRN